MYCKLVFDVPLDRDFTYSVGAEWENKIRPGVRVTAPFGHRLTTGLVIAVLQTLPQTETPFSLKAIACVLDEKPLFGSDLFALADFMKKNWGGAIGQILFSLVPEQAYFKLTELPPFQPYQNKISVQTDYPAVIFKKLNNYVENGFHRVVLSGADYTAKQALIFALINRVLQGYGQVLLTLPDVFSAHRFTTYCQSRFGKQWVFGWHSKMLLSEKKQIFSHISQGRPCVVVAARSGGLLPFKNLRLAVMLDEENDNYKQEENKPYFHLRDILDYRCRLHEALFITVSDTPSLETMYAVQQDRAENIAVHPQKQTHISFKVTSKKGEHSKFFSDVLIAQLKDNLENKQAALLIFNRRGYGLAYFCLNCGAYAKCKECGAILAHEKDKNGTDLLRCKKCGHTESLEQTCPKCQNKIFKTQGGGTQKIVTELGKLFPSARVLRLDSDTLKNKDGQGHQAVSALQAGEADIIVGTHQAVETAFSSRVTLAALLDADLELDSPDFRASERLGQFLFKLKNRLANRPNARLIVQASSADIYPFDTLQGAYEDCAKEELLAREHFGYPPYVKLVKVLLKSKDPVLLEAEMARVMSAAAPYSTHMLGPVQTGKKTDVLKKQYFICKTTEKHYPHLTRALDQIIPSKKTEVKVFVDPYTFY